VQRSLHNDRNAELSHDLFFQSPLLLGKEAIDIEVDMLD
jgi:hypothetical protein